MEKILSQFLYYLPQRFKATTELDDQDDQSSRPKSKKIRFIIYFIIIVMVLTSAFTLWKSHLKNPSTAIHVACSKTFNHHLCFNSISFLHKNSSNPSKTISTSRIFTLSLQAGIKKLSDETIPAIKKALIMTSGASRSLRECANLLHDALVSINASLTIMGSVDIDPNERIFFHDANFNSYMKRMIQYHVRDNIEKCRRELYYMPKNEVLITKMNEARSYVDNSLRILYYRDEIHEELNPTIEDIWNSVLVRFHFHPGLVLA